MSLDWPTGWDRTPAGDRTKNRSFEATLGATTQDLATEMDRMGVDGWRASIGNSHTKSNGLPLANANPDDPGFVLRWRENDQEYAVACDAYSRLRDNVRTVYKWIHETRMRGNRPVRTGDSEFAAARLPPGDGDENAVVVGSVSNKPAHEVLGVDVYASSDEVLDAYYERVKEAHPDHGGSEEELLRVRDAKEEMLGGDR
ncbi:J domain-containing protein [Halorubrum sp. AD140]|uniref:J domain-containing protein n=1 Tax=Halorubrum sp. AD140 TaxID=3050073 RepID=UPI002ACD0FD7|nr:J domain-containing protein [Halorubrum sp. AD140]MDZ5812393.1 J domain-containing protein [Halorubrum sp. AD140]